MVQRFFLPYDFGLYWRALALDRSLSLFKAGSHGLSDGPNVLGSERASNNWIKTGTATAISGKCIWEGRREGGGAGSPSVESSDRREPINECPITSV